jgi:ATP-dependent helicase HrpA
MKARWGKIHQNGPEWDRQRRALFHERWGRFTEAAKAQAKAGLHDPNLVEYRCLLEEYRVHLFAQEIHTSVIISENRLDAAWEKVQRP